MNKPVISVCDECYRYRVVKMSDYRDLCNHCVKLVKYLSDNTRILLSESHIGSTHSDETLIKMSKNMTGVKHGGMTDERKQRISAQGQGIPYEKWTGFAKEQLYCEKFDEACRERIRAKYNHGCFVCDKPQDENITKTGKHKKLSVHHADMDKNQGCDGVQWKLVPLCMTCHSKSHFEPMKSRIEYVIKIE